MKNLLLLLIVLPTVLFGQQEVPQKYWLDDSNYEETINGNSAFGDDDEGKSLDLMKIGLPSRVLTSTLAKSLPS